MKLVALGMLVLTVGSTAPAEPAESPWTKLLPGMTPAQVTKHVGTPLLQNVSRGHEFWVFDFGACAQFYRGALQAWTPPADKAAPVASPKTKWAVKPDPPALSHPS
ncbi:MAG: hypothetical protein Q8J74_03030 [Candidatus Didemnitutus sp.]|nr:hypothetical protein [Candidatus Didemnitutus sp.]